MEAPGLVQGFGRPCQYQGLPVISPSLSNQLLNLTNPNQFSNTRLQTVSASCRRISLRPFCTTVGRHDSASRKLKDRQHTVSLSAGTRRRWSWPQARHHYPRDPRKQGLFLTSRSIGASTSGSKPGEPCERSLTPVLSWVGAYQADHKAALLQAGAQLKTLRGQLTEALAGNHRRLQVAIQAHEATLARLSVVQRRLDTSAWSYARRSASAGDATAGISSRSPSRCTAPTN